MKKVLYLGGFELPDKNAAAQRVLSNAKLLREMGYNVSFIGVSKDINNAPKSVEGFESTPVSYPNNTKQWIHQIIQYIDFNIIKQKHPDYVILYNFPAIASIRILNYCHREKIKVIHDLTEWEAIQGWSVRDFIRLMDINLRMRYCIKKMDGVIAISRYLYNYYKSDVKSILVPPTVDLSSPKWNRDRALESNRPISLVYAGSPGGGIKDRLDLIVDAVRNNTNIKLDVVGIDEDQFFKIYSRPIEHFSNVEFKGRIPHVDALKAVCNADFQVLIRYHNRKNDAGFPTKLVESMSCGTPVIATVFSNITDYVKDCENGFIIDGDDTIYSVINKISQLHSKDIISMKQKCLEMRVFDYHSYIKEFRELFN